MQELTQRPIFKQLILISFVAVWTDDFMHGDWISFCWLDWYLPEHTGAYAGPGDRAWGSNAVAGTPMNARQTLVLNHILDRALQLRWHIHALVQDAHHLHPIAGLAPEKYHVRTN